MKKGTAADVRPNNGEAKEAKSAPKRAEENEKAVEARCLCANLCSLLLSQCLAVFDMLQLFVYLSSCFSLYLSLFSLFFNYVYLYLS